MATYAPPAKEVNSGGDVIFDATGAATGAAQVLEVSGSFEARVFLEVADSAGDYVEIFQYPTPSLRGRWNTKDIQPIIESGSRRIRVRNSGLEPGFAEVVGVEV